MRLARVTDFIPDSPPRPPCKTEAELYHERMRYNRRSCKRDALEWKERKRAEFTQRKRDNIVDEDADYDAHQLGIVTDEDGLDFVETDSNPGWTEDNVSMHSSDEFDEDFSEDLA